MRQRSLTLAVIALSMLAVASGCSRGDRGASTASPSIPFIAVSADAGPTDAAIADAQNALRDDPANRRARLALAQAFLQKARETADPTLYGKVDQLLGELDEEREGEPGVLIARGTLALALHEFADAFELGTAALAAAPGNQGALGVIVDAANELGRYGEAVEATQQMIDAKPNLASLSRVSYARELHGDLAGAIAAMTDAARAGVPSGENVAYIHTQLGLLLVTAGDLDAAAASFEDADQSFPGFVPAIVGRARALIADDRLAESAALLEEAIDSQPLAETVALHGDVLDAMGDPAGATRAYELVGAIAQLNRANGVRTDLEMAIFAADHQPGAKSVKAARAALELRPTIFAHDALAWNLFRAGDAEEAWSAMEDALDTGSQDPQLRYHAAAIAAAIGDDAAAREHLAVVLATNPRFSPLHAQDVQALARRLEL